MRIVPSAMIGISALSFVLLLAVGCGGEGSGGSQGAKQAPAAQRPAQKPAPVEAAKPAAPTVVKQAAASVPSGGSGSITGLISVSGDWPKPSKLDINKDVEVCGKTAKFQEAFQVGDGGELGNAVVYLKGVANAAPVPKPAENPLIDQLDCRYEPHVSLIPAGATIDIRNSDGILHNLHTYSTANPSFNAAQPKFKKIIKKQLDEPEFVRLTCDVHGWMEAWIVVHDHPYYALTDGSGRFDIEGVPAGEYEIVVWHERLGEKSGRVTVKAGEAAHFDAELTAS